MFQFAQVMSVEESERGHVRGGGERRPQGAL